MMATTDVHLVQGCASDGRTQAAPRAPLHSIVLGPTQIVKSSLSSSWPSILLERHLSRLASERQHQSTHVLSVVHGAPARFDYRNVNGVFLSATLRPKSIMITPQSAVPDVRLHTSADFSHCAFDDAFLRNVADEMEHSSHRPIFRLGIEDEASEDRRDVTRRAGSEVPNQSTLP